VKHTSPKAFEIVGEFEAAIGEYTGAPSVVAVNSCTMALRLCLDWHSFNGLGLTEYEEMYGQPARVSIPKRTYLSVPMQIKKAGFNVAFREADWEGCYQLQPFTIWDSARWFTSKMFDEFKYLETPGFVCVSFYSGKPLSLKRFRSIDITWDENGVAKAGEPLWDIEQGGAILHNAGPEADHFFRAMRHDGRIEGQLPSNESVRLLGHHCYMNPSSARLGLRLLAHLPKHNPPLPNDDFPDLSTFEVFK
jgi:hypothetical protein